MKREKPEAEIKRKRGRRMIYVWYFYCCRMECNPITAVHHLAAFIDVYITWIKSAPSNQSSLCASWNKCEFKQRHNGVTETRKKLARCMFSTVFYLFFDSC